MKANVDTLIDACTTGCYIFMLFAILSAAEHAVITGAKSLDEMIFLLHV